MKRSLLWVIVLGSLGLLYIWATGRQVAYAGPMQQEALPTSTRPPFQPFPSATPTSPPQPQVAAIELHAPQLPIGTKTGVQWQDGLGGWHNVEGWRGALDTDHQAVNWVMARDFGTGLFRWVLYEPKTGKVQTASVSFLLPQHGGDRLVITLTPLKNTPTFTSTIELR